MINKKKIDGRANNGRPPLPPGEKKTKLALWAMDKNHEAILEKLRPLVKKMDVD